MSLLEVRNLTKHFSLRASAGGWRKTVLKAVDGVSFTVDAGETLGVVGEFGCGKTTLGRCILRLIEPTSGEVRFGGRDTATLRPTERRRLRRDMQIIFQDPYGSLNPRMRVCDIIEEGLIIHGLRKADRKSAVQELIEAVGLRPEQGRRFPHEFSGGQRQRIGIARALSVEPQLIVADECVSALDVSIQAQIINLLQELQDKRRLAYMFISHDLRVVSHISHRVAVMYRGRIVETASPRELFSAPAHPYTQTLLDAVPASPGSQARRVAIATDDEGDEASQAGCPFYARCAHRKPICAEAEPFLVAQAPDRQVACHLFT